MAPLAQLCSEHSLRSQYTFQAHTEQHLLQHLAREVENTGDEIVVGNVGLLGAGMQVQIIGAESPQRGRP